MQVKRHQTVGATQTEMWILAPFTGWRVTWTTYSDVLLVTINQSLKLLSKVNNPSIIKLGQPTLSTASTASQRRSSLGCWRPEFAFGWVVWAAENFSFYETLKIYHHEYFSTRTLSLPLAKSYLFWALLCCINMCDYPDCLQTINPSRSL